MKTSNKNAGNLDQRLESFKGSNLEGKDHGHKRFYVIYSYGWYPIFVYDRVDHRWLENQEGYSPSTKRQMSHIRHHVPKCLLKSHEELKILLANSDFLEEIA